MTQINNIKSVIDFFHAELDDAHGRDEVTVIVSLVFKKYKAYSKIDLSLSKEEMIDNTLVEIIRSIIHRLKKQEPIQYILGETQFYGLNLKVDKNVLIPRPETEELVELIIKGNENKKNNIMDIGTGSGCIAIALKKNIPGSVITAIDVSADALEIASLNAINNKADINFIKQDILSDKILFTPSFYDIIVSNPPYVTQNEKNTMRPNVINYEPHLALFVNDNDPLLFYNSIVKFSKKYLNKNGKLYFEINEKYSLEICDLLKDTSFKNIQLKKDLSGKNRFVVCQETEH